jgi:TonB family protein
MTAGLFLDNLLAWSAQIAILTAIAAAAALLLNGACARLMFWQAMLAAMLVLPVFEPWVPSLDLSTNGVSISMHPVTIAGSAAAPSGISWHREYILYLIAAGTLLRLIWIGVGFFRLRLHRLAASTLADPPVPFEREHVRWYVCDTVSGPVTFGWLRPSILLPSRIQSLPGDLQEAIATHELVHVDRADWLFVLAEELIRAALWFHPAVWFVLSRIQLAREQTVDRKVIALTRNRDRYLEALVAVAQHKLQPDLAPAPLFLKKRQLAARVADILKETRMSRSRIAASFAAVFSAALVAARIAVWFFPLQAPAQSVTDAKAVFPDAAGVTVDPGAPLMHRLPVNRGSFTGSGTVVVEASVNSKGEVTDARVVSGPDELRKPVLQSVLQWHYSTVSSLPPVIRATIKFDPVHAGQTSATLLAAPPQSVTPATIKTFEFAGISTAVEQQVRQALTVHEGDTIAADTLRTILGEVRGVDEHLAISVMNRNSPDGHREATIRIGLENAPSSAPAASPAAGSRATAADSSTPPQRIRVGGNVAQANLIVKVTPVYPPDAKQARIQGKVSFTATIGKDGTIQNLDVLTGEPVLVQAAQDAVKQWIYKPTLLNGNPVEVITQIDVNFTLTQ